ncbi:hypothetical protein Psfp_02142 [Pelotomaculum sp. FP]|uniref:DUF3231 family protein n=1 Tax=Pelotomaculum sp. FP TaxID=261474 RepID=UPI0010649195|nr:DUF3231 family protein [Pelotomaculum sp. FP]TEB15494.1 hypothetical protein Psfp_02142 [Pelotomaculum sp. FP]
MININPFEVILNAFKPFLDKEKPPINVMEVSNLWFYFAGSMSTLRNEEVAYNVIEDEELKEWFKDAIENLHKPIIQELKAFLDQESVPLPKIYSDFPSEDYRSIPQGTKLTDEETANLMSYNLSLALKLGMRGITESIRPDIGFLYSRFIAREIAFSLSLKDLMQKRGWTQIPPAYYPTTEIKTQ